MSRLDLWVARAVDLWFSGKFYPLFAMLFGVGVHLQSRRLGSDFVRTFSRRLIILALIGLSFCLLIEDRSVLLSYALLGMFLVPLRNIRFGHLVALVVALVLMAALCMPPRSARHSVPEQAASAQHSRSHSVDAATYVAGVGLRVEGLLHDAADGEPFQQWPLTLAMIILGFLAGREPRFKVLWTCARTLRTHIAAPALPAD